MESFAISPRFPEMNIALNHLLSINKPEKLASASLYSITIGDDDGFQQQHLSSAYLSFISADINRDIYTAAIMIISLTNNKNNRC